MFKLDCSVQIYLRNCSNDAALHLNLKIISIALELDKFLFVHNNIYVITKVLNLKKMVYYNTVGSYMLYTQIIIVVA